MFGLVLAGRPLLTDFQTVSPTELSIAIPAGLSFSHVVVFLLPGSTLPVGSAAAVYIKFPSSDFVFLGAVANEKPSAIFKVKEGKALHGGLGADEMSDDTAGQITIGISLQDMAAVKALMEAKPVAAPVGVKDMAKKIMQNAYNFLSSFADARATAGKDPRENVVPLKAFEDWWTKFEKKVELDPAFLTKNTE